MRFAQWLIFEDIKEDFDNCHLKLLSNQADELFERALKTRGFIEENVDFEVIQEVWQYPTSVETISENLSDCNCQALMAKSSIPVNCCSLKCIKDLMVQVRLGGIEERKKDIENLQVLHNKQIEAVEELEKEPENPFLLEDLEDVAKEKIKLLIKLGHIRKKETWIQNFYLDEPKDRAKNIEELDKRTINALEEKNNEVPEEMKIYLNPNANNDFGAFLMKMFVKGDDVDRAGDIFQSFVKRLTSKKIKNGEATWKDFAGLKGTLQDLEDSECDDSSLGSPKSVGKESPILNRLSKFMKANISKSGRSGSEEYVSRKETVTSRTAKQSIINNDLGRTKAKGQINWSKKGSENLGFYRDALNSLFNGEEINVVSREDRLRKEIVEDIFFSKSTNKDLFPIRPPSKDNIILSLESYYDFLKASTISKVTEVPRTGLKSSSEEEDTDAAILSSLRGKSKKDDSIGKTDDPLKQLMGKEEMEVGALGKINQKLKKMLLGSEEEMQQALAFCIKYGLDCRNFDKINVSKDVFRTTTKGDALKGLPVQVVANQLTNMLKKDIPYQKARNLTMDAEAKIRIL